MAKKSRQKPPVNVIVRITPGMMQAGGGMAKRAVTSAIIANPLIALVAIIIAFLAILVIGGFTLVTMLQIITNPWFLVACVGANFLLRPNSLSSNIILALFIGGLFWGYIVLQEYLAMQAVCNIPFIGWLICGGWNAVTFLPKMFSLAVHILTAFILTIGVSALRTKASGKKGGRK
jgi:hypothetical protein